MATGDVDDQNARLKGYLPPWFGDAFPLLAAVLNGIATVNSFLYGLISYAALQARIMTASGGFLDLIASDFFGPGILRGAGQSDTSFRNTIVVNLFRERATRHAVAQVLTDLTGNAPIIFEPSRVQDTGGYGMSVMGYGMAGRYGSLLLPYQAFVTAFRPTNSGIPNVAGYGISTGGYSTPSQAEYASLSMVLDAVSDAEIFAAIDGVKVAGTIVWAQIGNSYSPNTLAPNYSLYVAGGPLVIGAATTPAPNRVRLLGYAL